MTSQNLDQNVATICWRMLAPEHVVFPAEVLVAALSSVMNASEVNGWMNSLTSTPSIETHVALDSSADRFIDETQRKDQGIYFTPPRLANAMARVMLDTLPNAKGCILDLSAGQGGLLLAMMARAPQHAYIAMEQNPALAVLAATRLIVARRQTSGQGQQGAQDHVFIGDGLRRDLPIEMPVIGVLGNPPYVGEKYHRDLFRSLQQKHTDLAAYFGARMDLQYLFFHRALDWLIDGGVLVYLTGRYWLQASGAGNLRADLCKRGTILSMISFDDQSLFEDAPGHTSLLTVVRKCNVQEPQQPQALVWRADPASLNMPLDAPTVQLGTPAHAWRPFRDALGTLWLNDYLNVTRPLQTLVRSYQGFVSGMDRVSKAHQSVLEDVQLKQPVFMFESWSDVPKNLHALKHRWLFPVLRGSQVRSDSIHLDVLAHSTPWALYIDAEVTDPVECALVESHLAPFEPVLRKRREVMTARIPWYRLHWPRNRQVMLGPKLVIARRATGACFGLDLAGHVVSSDCTFIAPPINSDTPVEDLIRLMLVLNTPLFAQALALTGKQKGSLLEFYAQPLKQWSVPLMIEANRLVWRPPWDASLFAFGLEEKVTQVLDLLVTNDQPCLTMRELPTILGEEIWKIPLSCILNG